MRNVRVRIAVGLGSEEHERVEDETDQKIEVFDSPAGQRRWELGAIWSAELSAVEIRDEHGLHFEPLLAREERRAVATHQEGRGGFDGVEQGRGEDRYVGACPIHRGEGDR